MIDRTVVNYIAKYPETGVTLTARYAGNSESIARTHYLAWLSQETGEKWFAVRRPTKQNERPPIDVGLPMRFLARCC